MEIYKTFDNGPLYVELDVLESVKFTVSNDNTKEIQLFNIGYQGPSGRGGCSAMGWITIDLVETRIDIPLGWWRKIEGVIIGAEINNLYNNRFDRKTLEDDAFRLNNDARIFLQQVSSFDAMCQRYAFPIISNAWSWTPSSNWLTKYGGGSMTHEGIDLACPTGVGVIRAAMGGEVVYVGGYKEEDEIGGTGIVVGIIGDDGLGYLYVHMSILEDNIKEGAKILTSQHLGLSGASGYENINAIPHLHFEMIIGDSSTALKHALCPPFRCPKSIGKSFRVNPFPYLCAWFDDYLINEDHLLK